MTPPSGGHVFSLISIIYITFLDNHKRNLLVKTESKLDNWLNLSKFLKVLSPGCHGNKTLCPTHFFILIYNV